MTEQDWIFLMALATLFMLGVMYVSNIIRTDTYANQKRLTRLATGTYLVAFIGLLLATYYFRVDETYKIYFIAGVLMLACLPAALFSLGVSTITVGNI